MTDFEALVRLSAAIAQGMASVPDNVACEYDMKQFPAIVASLAERTLAEIKARAASNEGESLDRG